MSRLFKFELRKLFKTKSLYICTAITVLISFIIIIVSKASITNYSIKPIRRLDQQYTISYSSDVNLALKVISEVAKSQALVLKNPEPFVKVQSYADSSIVIILRVWMKNEDYWTVNFDLLDQVKKALDENHIEIPFNQLDVTIKNK